MACKRTFFLSFSEFYKLLRNWLEGEFAGNFDISSDIPVPGMETKVV